MVTELVVSGAFHSPLMGDATQGLTSALEDLNIGRGDIPVYTNVTARPAENEDDIRKLLNLQLLSPVLWEQTVQNMIADGATRFYEVGAGKVLRGLLKRINSEVTAIGVGTAEEIAQLN